LRFSHSLEKLEIAIEKRFGREWDGLTPREKKYYIAKMAFALTRIVETA
jgi:hypothetical protein